jgi:hypothetical protein
MTQYSGLFTLSQQFEAIGPGNWPDFPRPDPNFEYNTLLLNGDGTNGAQNNTFLDSSTNNFTITRNGNTTQGSFSPYGSNWGVYFGGNQNFIAPTQTAIGTGDFTLEGWVNISVFTNRGCLVMLGTDSTPYGPAIRLNTDGSVNATIENTNGITGSYVTSASNLVAGTWYHIAYVRTSGTLTLYINGVSSGTPVTNTTNCTATLGCVGGQYPDYSSSGRCITGYISNARVVRGQALFSGTFTPSTLPLTTGTVGATGAGAASSITGTVSFLVCNENRFATSWTFDGTPSVQRFSPFNPTAPYSTSVIGGSIYVDGTTNEALTAPQNTAFEFGTGDFTIEGWAYKTSAAGEMGMGDWRSVAGDQVVPVLAYRNGDVIWYINGAIRIQATFTPINCWVHVAVSRISGSTKLFINGVQGGSTYSDSNNYLNPGTVKIAGFINGTSLGYLSDFRAVKGTGLYSTTFTPPTAPLTAVTNTSLLLKAINAGIPDLAMQNNLQTVGNAQVSTSVKKYGTGSLAFDGTGDYIYSVAKPTTSLNGNFTIEGWAYLNATGQYRFLTVGDSKLTSGIEIYSTGSNWTVYSNDSTKITGASISRQTWVHLALVRSGSTITLYVNGTASGSTWTSTASVTGGLYIGAEFYNSTVLADTSGYIDDLRITNGLARYTANFTPPTQAFQTY